MPNNQGKKDLRSDIEKRKRKLTARMLGFQEQKKRALEKRGRRPETKEREEEQKPSEGKKGSGKREQAGEERTKGKKEGEKRRGSRPRLLRFRFGDLLPTQGRIAGLTIGPDAVRVLLLRSFPDEAAGQDWKIEARAEAPLPPGTIENGRVKNFPVLVGALGKLRREGPATPFVVLSVLLSDLDVWGKTFSFPGNLKQDQLREAMDLNARFSLPFPRDAVFVDWEEIPARGEDLQETFLVAARTDAVRPYLQAAEEAGFTPVACEVFPMSLARALHQEQQRFRITAFFAAGLVSFAAVLENTLRFMRTMKLENPDARGVFAEFKKAWHFTLSEYPNAPESLSTLFVGDERIGKELASLVEREFPVSLSVESSFWAVTLGAAKRGAISREKDTIISLMPVGTEEAYARRRALLFVEFVGNFSVGIAALLLVLFAVVFGIVWQQEQTASNALQRLGAPPQGTEKFSQEANEFNALAGLIAGAEATAPRWDNLLEKIRSVANPGITIKHIAMTDARSSLTISGQAETASARQQFKNDLEQNGVAENISIPFTAELRDIQFTFTFPLMDTTLLFRSVP